MLLQYGFKSYEIMPSFLLIYDNFVDDEVEKANVFKRYYCEQLYTTETHALLLLNYQMIISLK